MDFLYSSWFKYIIFPIVCLFGTIMLKAVMRPASSPTFRREDLILGNELVWLSLTILLAGVTEKAAQYRDTQTTIQRVQKYVPQISEKVIVDQIGLRARSDLLVSYLTASGYVIFAIFFLALAMSLLMRLYSWDTNGDPHTWRGIALPIIIGLGALGAVMNFLSVPGL